MSNHHCSIKFNVELWSLYSNSQRLDDLHFLRKIINECKKIQPEINDNGIQLPIKIHNTGFYEIQKGTLTGERLLRFLGEDETFYIDKQMNEIIKENDFLNDKLDYQEKEINRLNREISNLESRKSDLENENSSLRREISHLESVKSDLRSKLNSL